MSKTIHDMRDMAKDMLHRLRVGPHEAARNSTLNKLRFIEKWRESGIAFLILILREAGFDEKERQEYELELNRIKYGWK